MHLFLLPTVGQPECGAGGEVVEDEELLLLADSAMVALLGLLQVLLVFLQQLLVRERHSVHALQRVVLGVAQPLKSGSQFIQLTTK